MEEKSEMFENIKIKMEPEEPGENKKIKFEPEDQDESDEIRVKMEDIDETGEAETLNEDDVKKLKCPIEGCDFTFSKKTRLDFHMRKHTNERPFQCDECDKTYTNESHLRRHKKAAHPENGVIETLPCPHEGCMKQLANVYSLRKHIHRYHNPLRKYRFECNYCNAGFLRKSQLNVHLSTHTGKPPYHCEPCNIGFMMKAQYTKHLVYHKTFECACGISFTRWTVFCEHKRSCKTCEKTFICEYCNKIFQAKNKYNQHVKTHLEDAPKFCCTYGNCNRVYKYERNLRVHIKVFHMKIAPKKIKCTVEGCDKEFVSNNNLKYHLQLHANPYKPKFPRNLRKDFGTHKKSSHLKMTGLTLPYEAEKMLLENREANIYLNSDTDGIYSSDANTNINSDVTDTEMEQGSPNKNKNNYETDASSYDHFLTPSTSGIKRVKKESSSFENEVPKSSKKRKTKKAKRDDSSESTSDISEQVISSHDESDQSEVAQNNTELANFTTINIKKEPTSDTSDHSDTDQNDTDFSKNEQNVHPKFTKISIKQEASESDNLGQSLPNNVDIKTEKIENESSETEQSYDDDNSKSGSGV